MDTIMTTTLAGIHRFRAFLETTTPLSMSELLFKPHVNALYVWTAILASAVLLLLIRKNIAKRRASDLRLKLPPGTAGWPLLGETLELIAAFRTSNPEPFTETRQARYGPVFRTHLFGQPSIFSTDAQFNKFVLQNEGRLFTASYPTSMQKVLGRNSLLLTHGPRHKELYSLTWSFINSSAIKEHLMADIDTHVCSALDSWPVHPHVVHIQNEAKKITFDLSVRQLLSADPGEWTENLRQKYLLLVESFFAIPVNLPGTRFAKAMKARGAIVKIVKQLIEKRRDEMRAQEKHKRVDLLESLLEQNMDDDQIVDMVISLLVAGYETTSVILTLVVKYLTDSPKALEQLQAELYAIKNSKKPGEKLNWDDYKSMTFTHCVINETLRKGNIVAAAFRKASQDIEVEGFMVPKGWIAILSFRAVHHNKSDFENPHEFNPWRWLGCNPNTSLNYKFMPFGGGPRFCPGYELAKVEIAIFLYHLTTKFSWQAAEEDEVIFFPTTRMVKMLPVTVRRVE